MITVAVIGAGYGDEGKGRTVDDLLIDVDPVDALVVRHNSSAQAGHTVDHGDRRHVFSHFGSGTLRGVPTYLGPKFVINPGVFVEELAELRPLVPGFVQVYGHPDCKVTTPYDIAMNQLREVLRGPRRHGSCGLGFGESIGRAERAPELTIYLKTPPSEVRALLPRIRDHHYASMLDLNGLAGLNHPAADFITDPDPDLSTWLGAFGLIRSFIHRAAPTSFETKPFVVFEGAQGLMLDQHRGAFPHVTRCNTGLDDVVALAAEMRRDMVTPHYVLRPYLTRHGAGPLGFEVDTAPVASFSDATNQPNEWQGTMRFGLMDRHRAVATIKADLAMARATAGPWLIGHPRFTMTCLDQLADSGKLLVAGVLRETEFWSGSDLARSIGEGIAAERVEGTYGAVAGSRCNLGLGRAA